MPVMVLDDVVAGYMGAETRVAILSADTMRKQNRPDKRPDLAVSVYRQLPLIGADPTIVARNKVKGNHFVMLRQADGRWTVAVIKRTADGSHLFVVSVRDQSERTALALLKGSEVLLDRR